jgi:hypothetical protein
MEQFFNQLAGTRSVLAGVAVAAIAALVDCSSSDTASNMGYSSGSGSGGTTANGGNVGTSGTAGATGNTTASFASIYDSIISVQCLSCHANSGVGVSVGMLDMSTPQLAYAQLVGASGAGIAAQGTAAGASNTTCSSVSGLLRVDPGNAQMSLLWQKVNAKLQGANAPCGNSMPASGAALTQAAVDEIAAWIDAGAVDN